MHPLDPVELELDRERDGVRHHHSIRARVGRGHHDDRAIDLLRASGSRELESNNCDGQRHREKTESRKHGFPRNMPNAAVELPGTAAFLA